ncbi:hypothetical protein EAI_05553 [Harpegnathos saltator]|uniref:Uncharacterized protein n=1 Tax=Harpegnathos saltator TaxID=610380 RepID=E2BYF6_HARSA|nr:hypothetical protein EAI_05553 [Harpegnathos saltator]
MEVKEKIVTMLTDMENKMEILIEEDKTLDFYDTNEIPQAERVELLEHDEDEIFQKKLFKLVLRECKCDGPAPPNFVPLDLPSRPTGSEDQEDEEYIALGQTRAHQATDTTRKKETGDRRSRS